MVPSQRCVFWRTLQGPFGDGKCNIPACRSAGCPGNRLRRTGDGLWMLIVSHHKMQWRSNAKGYWFVIEANETLEFFLTQYCEEGGHNRLAQLNGYTGSDAYPFMFSSINGEPMSGWHERERPAASAGGVERPHRLKALAKATKSSSTFNRLWDHLQRVYKAPWPEPFAPSRFRHALCTYAAITARINGTAPDLMALAMAQGHSVRQILASYAPDLCQTAVEEAAAAMPAFHAHMLEAGRRKLRRLQGEPEDEAEAEAGDGEPGHGFEGAAAGGVELAVQPGGRPAAPAAAARQAPSLAEWFGAARAAAWGAGLRPFLPFL
jgi:hypothetical protein